MAHATVPGGRNGPPSRVNGWARTARVTHPWLGCRTRLGGALLSALLVTAAVWGQTPQDTGPKTNPGGNVVAQVPPQPGGAQPAQPQPGAGQPILPPTFPKGSISEL